jgi:hypothetical protein
LREIAATGSSAGRRRLPVIIVLLITVAMMQNCRLPDINHKPYMGFTPLGRTRF